LLTSSFCFLCTELERRAKLLNEEDDAGKEEEEEEEESNTPTYDFRINTAKILVELEEPQKASQVLEMLLAEDDEVVEIWYLLGYVYVLLKERKAAEETLKKAKKVRTGVLPSLPLLD